MPAAGHGPPTAAALLVLGVLDVLSGQFSGNANRPLRLVWSVAA
ncbi:hypothetical protein APASM_1641 [Actinosynnema pretiosum subsp. pretiosum]|nr:hypothetical protein APASM_1641 [Actinosynnema pretiosum subsp. pretiosum]